MDLLLILIPVIASGLFWTTGSRKKLHIINVAGSLALLLAAAAVTIRLQNAGVITYSILNGFFYIDALNALVLDITAVVSFLVSLYSVGYLNSEYPAAEDLKRIKLYYSLTSAFIFTMVLAATTQNLGLLWIAIEATTLASVFLVGFFNTKRSLEAAWKYIIICSVGIALAFLGIVFLYYSAHLIHNTESALNWSFLSAQAGSLDSGVLKLAFIFILVGFGTKAGLAPMHTWLPDAHSEAPSPVSALLSGVLLNNAMYGIVRFMSIVNKNLGDSTYTGRLMIAFGLLSVGASVLFILAQKDYKRTLAYSSIEHMGIISFALGLFTPASLLAAFFHMFNHSLTKSMLFLCAGNVLHKFKSKEIISISGLFKAMPLTGGAFFLGILAIAGLPPFSIFASELNIIIAAFTSGHIAVGSVFTFQIAAAFAAIAYALFRMFFGTPAENHNHEDNPAGNAVILALLAAILITGFYLPPFLQTLFASAARIVYGG
ncbi:MAG: hydrogenase 4 subunit F [Clostridia bacterium]|jgi:hydrogenase-4 component F|nr:hydrogenase 4 subunit F [Clostridia bacterium]